MDPTDRAIKGLYCIAESAKTSLGDFSVHWEYVDIHWRQ